MASVDAGNFRLAVLNPAGRDPEQHFGSADAAPVNVHPPVNFHAYAACTGGAVFRDTKHAIASGWPVLVLLRGDFRATERALAELKKARRITAVSLKETGAHQIAQQLSDPTRLARFTKIVNEANGCIATTPEAADLFRAFRGEAVAFFANPVPHRRRELELVDRKPHRDFCRHARIRRAIPQSPEGPAGGQETERCDQGTGDCLQF